MCRSETLGTKHTAGSPDISQGRSAKRKKDLVPEECIKDRTQCFTAAAHDSGMILHIQSVRLTVSHICADTEEPLKYDPLIYDYPSFKTGIRLTDSISSLSAPSFTTPPLTRLTTAFSRNFTTENILHILLVFFLFGESKEQNCGQR